MKKKINIVSIITCALGLISFILLLTMLLKYVSVYQKSGQGRYPIYTLFFGKDKYILLILSLITSLLATISSALVLFYINRTDIKELLSSSKEKRAELKAKRKQEKVAELEEMILTLEEKLNKEKNDMKKGE